MLDGLVGSLQRVQGVSFASFNYRAKGTGSLAKVLIILGASIENVYKKDIAALEKILPYLRRIAKPDTIKAAEELLASRQKSLAGGIGNNPLYTQKGTFTHLNHLPGVKIHNETGELYIVGLVEKWETIEPGAPKKPVNSSAKTLAKEAIEKRFLRSNSIKSLCLGNVKSARVRGNVLEFEDAQAV